MPNTEGNLVAFHDVRNVEAIEILKTSSDHGWKNLFAYTARLQPFNSVFQPVDSLLVAMVLKGHLQGAWQIGGELSELYLQPGSIIVIPPDESLKVSINSNAEVINIYISKNLMDDVFLEFSSVSNNLFKLDYSLSIYDEFLEQTINSVKDILYVGGRFSSIEVQYIARLLVARVVSKYSTLTSGDLNPDAGLSLPTLQKTFDYIDENLHRRIVIDKLANTAGVGAAQFARLFKRATNVTLHQYIIRRRVDKARDLLMETQMPIAEIAHECGFADQVHLTRFFGRIIGTSPASFRRRAQR
ncbi:MULTISPECIES: helix-turn-helix domain-containing protein [Brucella]|jgi:AraC family transcriptional regulator|uniref:AraC family transcriptional regulator n=2 Tax=Brucella pseudogrignonensis TaxID=419475 RepID=A0A7Y3WXP5_9HYPH|nr:MULTISPECIES: helix-turn-helix domain-containing protein [Brucella]EMG54002.1 AraC family transcriptional regulator [Ochrobactrum sp. CDB2]MBK0023671.1 helix-turn-helix transcriptional regulator [Ochrobactrum sp. S45]MBK0045534.1 helix-turn-helix transcriptional regulator [Ochrobactrum sp. S46]MBO1023244.1 helix-turn-helix transcriptional regulator [Ochrobactrum sp. SD129]MQP39314.1 helix-turn-helix domain-containing protein [Ochrobactrum sp. MYb237]QWK77045.1 AraC family transcriptional r